MFNFILQSTLEKKIINLSETLHLPTKYPDAVSWKNDTALLLGYSVDAKNMTVYEVSTVDFSFKKLNKKSSDDRSMIGVFGDNIGGQYIIERSNGITSVTHSPNNKSVSFTIEPQNIIFSPDGQYMCFSEGKTFTSIYILSIQTGMVKNVIDLTMETDRWPLTMYWANTKELGYKIGKSNPFREETVKLNLSTLFK